MYIFYSFLFLFLGNVHLLLSAQMSLIIIISTAYYRGDNGIDNVSYS